MRLNPDKCIFGVQADKFLGFMLTHRGIEANPNKYQEIIDMRSPTSVKEVQQLTRRLAALSLFLSCDILMVFLSVGEDILGHFPLAVRQLNRCHTITH